MGPGHDARSGATDLLLDEFGAVGCSGFVLDQDHLHAARSVSRIQSMSVEAPAVLSLSMLTAFAGGLALFLYGMELMTGALKAFSGDRMRSILARLTGNRFTGALAGILVTAVIQSSSVATVLVVGFVSAGLLNLTQAIPVIIGAGIGTTVTVQIIAFKITESALTLIAAGFALQLLARSDHWKQTGLIVLGLGLLFSGMTVMSDTATPLRNYPPFISAVQHLDSAVAGLLLSAVFTAIVQSSSATTALILVLAGQNLLTLEQAIPLVFGANIGTCITAVLASIGKSRDAVRAALVHVLFNTLGVLMWFGFQSLLAELVRRLSDDPGRQIAHVHTLFNATSAIVFIWFVTPLASLTIRLVPERPADIPETAQPKFLDEILLKTPAMALDAARLELSRLGIAALEMVRDVFPTVIRGDQTELDHLEALDDNVDALHAAILTWLGQLSRFPLSDRQSHQLHNSLLIANYFENIGDMIESNLVAIGRRRLRLGLVVSSETQQVLEKLHHEVSWAVERAIRSLADNDPAVAREVAGYRDEINSLVASAERHLSRRLAASEPLRLTAFRLESEILEHLKRIYDFAKRIASMVIVEPAAIDSEVVKIDEAPPAADTPPPETSPSSAS